MKIRSVRINNYRTIRTLEMELQEYSQLVGANQNGKSNILNAIHWGLSPDAPLASSDLSEFSQSHTVRVEFAFEDLTEAEQDAQKPYLDSHGVLRIARTSRGTGTDQYLRWERTDGDWEWRPVAVTDLHLPVASLLPPTEDRTETLNHLLQATHTQEHPDLLLIEEPELSLHPQAERELHDSFQQLYQRTATQVLVVTHSTQMISIEDHHGIVLVHRTEEQGTFIRQRTKSMLSGSDYDDYTSTDFNLVYFLNPYRTEIFFADFVVLVEGATEAATLPYLARRLGIFQYGVSVVDCQSIGNIEIYLKVLNAYHIPYLVVHDFDGPKYRDRNRELDDLIEARIGTLFVSKPDFERANHLPESNGYGKPLAALRYFESIENTAELPESVVTATRLAYDSEFREQWRSRKRG